MSILTGLAIQPVFNAAMATQVAVRAMPFNIFEQPSLYAWRHRQAGGEGSSGKSLLRSTSSRPLQR
ncbi:hypothetical protein, partial [Phytopseudomonas daroniae]|uniref:hypothetical protein n=1 Tax=Pseudomonadaceae TaxID=135621 RepID=UPI001A955F1C